ncbi:hypothetical protein ABB37_06951 [Leptomonas pyrrhocoris]|uniref:Uncharacterized protein n=1 Tax=Leptomonas pyrrhocoris TaxID=157538 RepID=A0A0N0DTU0_LEPPY|nr:hypothetical protein ABB37_06951 [Leptomonas pyrrhocoris]KPA77581.1 hypothetical protein ABB37_06951 [Leptomonas pyrrhocoris]|eukprot:XP_015656020.1 hypothetical protein ABB37_06951 [Leptomonas pyrrhocoris]
MSLIEEARSQLEVELTSYIRNAQQPYSPILPPIDDGLPSFHATLAKKPAAGLAATTAVVAAPADTGKAVKGSSKGGGATTAVAATSTSPSPSRAGSQKQARAKLLELVRKLQRAALVSAQVSKDEAGAADGSGGESSLLTRRGSRKEGGGLSREPSLFSAPLTTKSAVTNLPALPAAATRNVRTTSAEKIRKGAPGTSAAAAAAGGTTSASNTDVAAAPAKRADGRGASPHPPAQSFISLSLANTQTSQSFHRRLGDIERSHSTATSFSGRERSSSPHSSMRTNNNNSSAANSANALRRLEASLTFTKDCLHYAAMFAEAGLTQEAQSCFLQLIAQDITSHYEPIVTRCIERHPRTVARQTPQQSSQQQQQRNEAGAGTPGHPLRRHRVSKGKSFKDGQKQNLFSPNGAELASPSLTAPTTPTANEAQRTGNAAEDGVGGVRVTDNLDTFASDVPLPLALQVYKCVLHYRALLTYIRFHDLLQADVYGDAAGMASSTAACACIEEMVAQQQRVLYTAPFSAASVIHQEEARMREDMERTAAVMKPVSAIIVTGGYKLLDLLAEPESAKPSVTSLSVTSLLDDAPALVYAVDEVAAPVLFTTRLYVAKMAEQLLAYLRSTASGEMAQPGCGELRPAVTQRCLEALQASVSMSELHLNKATPQLQQQPQQSTQPRQPCTKTCLPLASVDYLPWRLQEYTLLQRGYLQLEDDTAAAVTAAEHALQQVLQLVELEYLDPVPPPPSTTLALDAAVQQCAGWLLVATWRAAVAQGGSGISSSSNTSNAYLAFASASPEASAVQPPGEAAVTGTQTPLAAATTTTTASAGGSFADSGAGGDSPASTALHMATTARTAMAAIAAAVQQAVAFLVTASWAPASTGGAASNPMHDMSPRRASRRGGGGAGNMIPSITTAVAITAAAAAGGGDVDEWHASPCGAVGLYGAGAATVCAAGGPLRCRRCLGRRGKGNGLHGCDGGRRRGGGGGRRRRRGGRGERTG